jgi:hypothetical protein
MSFDKYKINDQLKGSFGEYIYREFAKSKNFKVIQTNIAETDVELYLNGIKYIIDVKATETDTDGYKGIRSKKNIVYEQIVITNNYAKINPDTNSPFKNYTKEDLILKNIDELFQKWKNNKNVEKPINSYQKYRNEIKKKISHLFKEKNINIRVVCRGSVSLTRWSAKPDNLPGSQKMIDKYPATVFVQLGYNDNQNEKISNIFFINHKDLGKKIKLIEPDKRQKKKGITKVIDFKAFREEIPELIFKNLSDLASFVKKYK